MKERSETFIVDSDLQRDALYAGIWNRLCSEIRGPGDGHQLTDYIEQHAVGRGDPATLFQYLDEDIGCLTDARRMLRDVEATAIGATVELHDVARFMPVAWREGGPTGPGKWIYTNSETEEADLLAPEKVTQVRRIVGVPDDVFAAVRIKERCGKCDQRPVAIASLSTDPVEMSLVWACDEHIPDLVEWVRGEGADPDRHIFEISRICRALGDSRVLCGAAGDYLIVRRGVDAVVTVCERHMNAWRPGEASSEGHRQ